ncbi:DUF5131 family protein [Planktothrix agardhii]|uniref:DUF5131 family protein n=1 Tax=Planktothrix agardhii TaxID=1160 RepID=UPI0020B25465|nr:DUF5131 family protein [Planktothrix agardhii]CAD5984049.1 Phage Gp37Gp68 family protein [Planktothrix agardhii]CAD5985582.1 Phage Gp37Gp68 family protein [Planktothrix agardhii]
MTTQISWTDETINPIVGCSRVAGSPGCQNCYAASATKTARLQQFPQYQKVSKWNGTVEFVEKQLEKPYKWKKPKKIFICSMADIFHENVPFNWVEEIFYMIENCPQHTFQILTKRPERMIEFFDWYIARNSDHSVELQWTMPDNIWLGVSCENQAMADKRIPLLMQIPAKVRFLSCEPLLEPINLSKFLPIEWSEIAEDWIESWPGIGSYSTDYPNWIIVGLESGSNARRCDLQAVHSIINQCQTAKVKVFCKQLGTVWAKESGTYKQDRKGASPELWDKSFNVQEFPNC